MTGRERNPVFWDLANAVLGVAERQLDEQDQMEVKVLRRVMSLGEDRKKEVKQLEARKIVNDEVIDAEFVEVKGKRWKRWVKKR